MSKSYNPTPVYHRKMVRAVMRNGIIRKFGYHKVSEAMSYNFKKMRGAK